METIGPKKLFKFGNGTTQHSESFIHLHQSIGEHEVSLGVFTLDTSGVPLLIGVKSLERLGAVIDVDQQVLVLKTVDPRLVVPLRRSRTGHLLLDLCSKWLKGGAKILYHAEILKPTADEKVFVIDDVSKFDTLHAPSYPSEPMTLAISSRTSRACVSPDLSCAWVRRDLESSEALVFGIFEDEVGEVSEDLSPGLQFTLESDDAMPLDAQADPRGMSLRLLALLATTTFVRQDGVLQGRSQVEGQSEASAYAGHDRCGELRGGPQQVRDLSSSGAGPSRQQDVGGALHGFSRARSSGAGLTHGQQRPRNVGGLFQVSAPPPVHSSLRGTWIDTGFGSSAERCEAEG